MSTDLVSVELVIDNIYEDGEEIQTTVRTTVHAPPTLDENDDDYQDWAAEEIMPHTGTGKTEGDAGYFVKCVASSWPALIGREWEWGT